MLQKRYYEEINSWFDMIDSSSIYSIYKTKHAIHDIVPTHCVKVTNLFREWKVHFPSISQLYWNYKVNLPESSPSISYVILNMETDGYLGLFCNDNETDSYRKGYHTDKAVS